MKILHVISGGESGGSKNHLLSLFKHNTKHEMFLLVFTKGALYEEAVEQGINVKVMEQKSRYDVSVLSRLKKFVNTNDFDIVHSHGGRANFMIRMIQGSLKAKWVTTVHSDPELDYIHNPKMKKVFTGLNKWSYAKVDHFFAVSKRFKEMISGYGIPADKISTIYNGIDFSFVSQDITREEAGLNHADFTAMIVARLHPVKQHKMLLNAFKAFSVEHPEKAVSLVVVGEGQLEQELKQLTAELQLNEKVQFLGSRSDVPVLFRHADVSLLTSESESFPLVLLESAREKTPIISTDVGGVAQLIPENKGGWLIPIGDQDALTVALNEALLEKEAGTIEEKGQFLYEYARKNFSLHALQQSIFNRYEKILRK
ncbi:hypothetical protein JMA_29530 [Jeotgalibacillus malaysiensis]|uniref:Glycosyltransferase n=1 Tax=Jeotgalibacillus malaysiensis TaxID=1508404 RepID=A0A0B5APW3_9BACL|nr:glycosyltransferase [Jeotgalibacillus malaysiensis]AJD92270.1 hypothetical protein JMA_29530 [Jeotgalibacillus malaysiensis]